jgi:hypothetical protein
MSDLETRMVVQAYGMYLHEEKELEFSTIDKYKRQAIDYLENPETNQGRPPHLDQAMEILHDYTS